MDLHRNERLTWKCRGTQEIHLSVLGDTKILLKGRDTLGLLEKCSMPGILTQIRQTGLSHVRIQVGNGCLPEFTYARTSIPEALVQDRD